jgi:hypothetical protein
MDACRTTRPFAQQDVQRLFKKSMSRPRQEVKRPPMNTWGGAAAVQDLVAELELPEMIISEYRGRRAGRGGAVSCGLALAPGPREPTAVRSTSGTGSDLGEASTHVEGKQWSATVHSTLPTLLAFCHQPFGLAQVDLGSMSVLFQEM